MGGLGDARQAHLLQLLVDLDSGLVGPADHGKPAQHARESDERRHRSILVECSAPTHILAQTGPRRNWLALKFPWTKWRGRTRARTRISPKSPAFRPPRSARPAARPLIPGPKAAPRRAISVQAGRTAVRSAARSRA